MGEGKYSCIFLFLALDSILQFSFIPLFDYLPGIKHIYGKFHSYTVSNKPAEILPYNYPVDLILLVT